MITRLLKPTAQAKEALISLGVSLEEVNPTKVRLPEIIRTLNAAGLAAEENSAKLATIFDARYATNIRNALVIMHVTMLSSRKCSGATTQSSAEPQHKCQRGHRTIISRARRKPERL